MSFIPDSNRVSAWLVRIPVIWRYLCTVAIALIFIALWWTESADITGSLIVRRVNEAENLYAQCKSNSTARRHAKRLSRQIEQLQATLSEYNCLDETAPIDAFAAFDIPRTAGGKLRDCSTAYVADKGWYIKRGLRSRFSGTLSELISFVHAAKSAPGFMRCRDIIATRLSNGGYDSDLLFEAISFSKEKIIA